ncbi:hypothetical protein C900_00338 [Fulvivirga imtechensis AK7]|uniref:Uncharacterized protein n=1 Tax=Fulvivirga imtechensis AK7 TaxID=1237149 RepID=L8JLU9_9BACT|nr:hypothetical protein C900_00338 [Fulvivirga imtechensis AK7]
MRVIIGICVSMCTPPPDDRDQVPLMMSIMDKLNTGSEF